MALTKRDKYKIGDTERAPRSFEPGQFVTVAIVENTRQEYNCLYIGAQCKEEGDERRLMGNIYNILKYLNHQARVFDQIELEDNFSKFNH